MQATHAKTWCTFKSAALATIFQLWTTTWLSDYARDHLHWSKQ